MKGWFQLICLGLMPGAVYGYETREAPTQTHLTLKKSGEESGALFYYDEPALFEVKVDILDSLEPAQGEVIVFFQGSASRPLATVQLDAQGRAHSFLRVLHPAAIEGKPLIAKYQGQKDISQPSYSEPLSHVFRGRSTLWLTASLTSPATIQEQPIRLIAHVKEISGPRPPGGKIVFQHGSSRIAVQDIDPDGYATCLMQDLEEGNHRLTAAYEGDDVYASSQAELLMQILPQSWVESGVQPSVPSPPGQPGSPAQPQGCSQTGEDTLLISLMVIALGCAGLRGRKSRCRARCNALLWPMVMVGACVLVSAGGPHPAYAASDDHGADIKRVHVLKSVTFTTLTWLDSPVLVYGDPLRFKVEVSGWEKPLKGKVRIAHPGMEFPYQDVDLDEKGHGDGQLNDLLLQGSHWLYAAYQGREDEDNTSSVSAYAAYSALAPTHVSLHTTPFVVPKGQQVTWRAHVQKLRGPYQPTGMVLFKDGQTPLFQAPLDSEGNALYQTSELSPGLHTMEAEYQGDGYHACQASDPVVQIIVDRGPSDPVSVPDQPPHPPEQAESCSHASPSLMLWGSMGAWVAYRFRLRRVRRLAVSG